MIPGDAPNSDYIAWCQSFFAVMAEGGIWSVPRSGLVFRKQFGRLELIDLMPFTSELAEAASAGEDVPKSAEELRAYQDEDYELIREHFNAAGIEVRRA